MIHFEQRCGDFRSDFDYCLRKNGIKGITSDVVYKHPYGYKKFNFVIYNGHSAHIVWVSASQKERFRAIDRDAILLNRDSNKSAFFNKPHVELWYVGLVGDSQKEDPQKATERMRAYGRKCTGFKEDHVMSVYDDERFPQFIQTLLPSS